MAEKRTKAADATEAPLSATRERHPLAVRFDEFGWQALEAAAERHNQAVESLIADACGYFSVEVEAGRVATQRPRFRDQDGHGQPRELQLYVRSGIWKVLEQEAERQGAELPRIVEHAALLYLADVDSGRAVDRIVEPEERD